MCKCSQINDSSSTPVTPTPSLLSAIKSINGYIDGLDIALTELEAVLQPILSNKDQEKLLGMIAFFRQANQSDALNLVTDGQEKLLTLINRIDNLRNRAQV